MELYCTRPTCPRPLNRFVDLDDSTILKTVPQKYCTACGMPQILAGRYLPLKLLGRGGFGAAFLSRDRYTPTMRFCVVKQFQPVGNLTPDQLDLAQRLFEREAEVLEQLGNRHPQIPDLLAFFELDVPSRTPGETEKFFYLAQEFIDGQNMEELLEQRGSFSEAEVIQVLLAILKVLQFVHENGSIHRDIKPSNIMRHRDGSYYLLDFGAVKQVTTTAAIAGQSPGHSTGIYSRGYAPPEQVAGNVVYPSTDLYALAVTCITLLTGKQPQDLFDPASNSFKWQMYTKVSDRLATVLNRMLLPAPNQRFASAEQVIVAIDTPTPPTPAPQPAPAAPKAKKAAPPVATPVAQPAPVPSPASRPVPTRPAFSLLEIIGGAAFTGFETGLLVIALASVLGTSLFPGFWLILATILAGMIFAQSRRWIEKIDLVIIAAISFGAVAFVPLLNRVLAIPVLASLVTTTGSVLGGILLITLFFSLLAVAIALIFRLIYQLLLRLL